MLDPISVGAEMKLSSMKLTALVVSVLALSAGAATAQGMDATPSNFPPAGFQGTQFADSRGCVFVRAGFDGNVTWVPRVTRQRKHICGQTPTSFGGATRTAAAPQERPVQITATPPAATATVAAPTPRAAAAPAQRTAAPTQRAAAPTQRAAAPAPVRAAPAPVRAAPAPARVATTTRVVRQPAPQPQPQRVVRVPASKPVAAEPPRVVRRVPAATAQPGKLKTYRVGTTVKVPAQIACQNGQATRIADGQRLNIRCGPQQAPHVTTIRRGEAPAPGKNVHYNKSWNDSSLQGLPGDTRIVPRHVYETRDVSQAAIPAGYRPAWEDDRLNPYRAYMTLDGYDATQKIWTHTVPRRAIKRVGGYEDRDPIIAYRVKDSTYPAVVRYHGHQPILSSQGSAHRDPVVSTRGAAPAAAGERWVEIGAFTSASGAGEAAARLSAAGLPVRMATVTRGDQVMRSVRVGPYASGASLNAALSAVHGTGYTQAYLR